VGGLQVELLLLTGEVCTGNFHPGCDGDLDPGVESEADIVCLSWSLFRRSEDGLGRCFELDDYLSDVGGPRIRSEGSTGRMDRNAAAFASRRSSAAELTRGSMASRAMTWKR
jgi:hypothetical protein